MQVTRQAVVLTLTLQTLLTGCASITKDAYQPIKAETYSKKVAVAGAKRVGKNEYGEFNRQLCNDSTPDWVRVIMGDNLVYDRKNNKDNETMLGQASSLEGLKKLSWQKLWKKKWRRKKLLKI